MQIEIHVKHAIGTEQNVTL